MHTAARIRPKVLTAKPSRRITLLQDVFYWNKQARFPCAALNEKNLRFSYTYGGNRSYSPAAIALCGLVAPPAHNRWGWWKTCRQRLSCTTQFRLRLIQRCGLLPVLPVKEPPWTRIFGVAGILLAIVHRSIKAISLSGKAAVINGHIGVYPIIGNPDTTIGAACVGTAVNCYSAGIDPPKAPLAPSTVSGDSESDLKVASPLLQITA